MCAASQCFPSWSRLFAESPSSTKSRSRRMPPLGDHDLLFGVTALELGIVTQDQLVAATAAGAGAAALRQRLCDLKLLTADEANAVAAVVKLRVARSGDDVRKALDSAGGGARLFAPPGDQPTAVGKHADTQADYFQTQGPAAWSYSPQQQRFTVLRLHQQGGLGRLMIARDGELNREIALKEILPALADSEDNRRRFIREAEITGALEHPGVVPVYSLGEFADGRPYYAMRFIRGVDMNAAIEAYHAKAATHPDKQFEFRQLLGRFVSVCQAVHYAHSRGVLHRDLKPANIMLGDFGETLVVDWGLARMIDEAGSVVELDAAPITTSDRAATDRTQAGRVVGTIPYMSPEQALGRVDLVGPASDIYGLGATLYHLLTGRPPFDFHDDDMLVKVQQGRFWPPRDVDRRVPKALNAICVKAMARQAQDRYRTARDLALDVERYLSDERVLAYAEPFSGRAWRWIKRNRAAVLSLMAACTVAIVGLSTGVALLTSANQREREARQQADRNLQEAVEQRQQAERNFQLAQDAVQQYYVRVSEDTLLNQPGMQALRKSLLGEALGYYQKFLDQRGADPQLRGEVAQAHFFAGRITETVDSPQKALPHYEQAARLQEALLAEADGPAADGVMIDLAQTLNGMGRALQRSRRLDEARSYYQKASNLRQQLCKARPDDLERARELASSIMNLGLLELDAERPKAALPLLDQAQTLRLAHAGGGEALPRDFRRDLGMGYYNLALAHMALDDAASAERDLNRAIDAFQQLAEEEPRDLDNRRRIAISMRLIADAKRAADDGPGAMDYYGRARDALEKLHDQNPDVPEFAGDLAGVRMNLGALLEADGQIEPALVELTAAADELRSLADRDAASPSQRRDLGVALRASGVLLHQLARGDEARQRLDESKQVLERLVREHPDDKGLAAQLKQTLDALAALEAI